MDKKQIETIVNGLEPIALIIKADFNEDGIQVCSRSCMSRVKRSVQKYQDLI